LNRAGTNLKLFGKLMGLQARTAGLSAMKESSDCRSSAWDVIFVRPGEKIPTDGEVIEARRWMRQW